MGDQVWMCDAREWLPPLTHAKVTPQSLIISISKEISEAIKSYFQDFVRLYYTHLKNNASSKLLISPFKNPQISWLDLPEIPLDEHLQGLLDTLNAGILEILDLANGSTTTLKAEQCVVFSKLTSRSPKDSLALRRRRDILENSMSPESSSFLSMGCSTGKEILELLLTSQRVYEDLQAFSDELPGIMIREWRPCHPMSEFRCFVYHRCVTGITQYNSSSPAPYLQDARVRDALQSLLFGYINERIMPVLTDKDTYVLDVMIEGVTDAAIDNPVVFLDMLSQDAFVVTVIEVNPFCRKTGTALFSWLDDELMLKGGRSFEFRYKEE